MNAGEFLSYEKMAESPDRWRLDPAAYRLFRKTRWVVTEKIHGANFVFVADADGIRCANRRRLLEDGEPFFGWERVREQHAAAVRDLFTRVRAAHRETARLYVYGELFGGGYPHPDVPPVPGVQPVQTGVWYAPDIRFCAFDLRVEDAAGERRYLDYEEAMRLLDAAGLHYAVPLFVGAYEQATARPVRFDSTLPVRLGLPPLPPGTNLAEGVVIKPLREIALPTPGGTVRPVLKQKIPEFAEDRRFHEAEKWEESPAAPSHGGALDLAKWEAYSRLTENRLNAAVSKVGNAPERRAEVADLLAADVESDIAEGAPKTLAALNPAERRALSEYIREESGRLAG